MDHDTAAIGSFTLMTWPGYRCYLPVLIIPADQLSAVLLVCPPCGVNFAAGVASTNIVPLACA